MKATFAMAVQLLSLALIAKLPRLEVERRLDQALVFYQQVKGTTINKDYQFVMRMNSIWFRLDYGVDIHLVPGEFADLEAQPIPANLMIAFRQLKKKYMKRTNKIQQRILILSDVSGSMQGDKLTGLQLGMKQLIRNLERPFTLTVSTFAADLREDLGGLMISSADNIATAEHVVDAIVVRGGGTHLYGAMYHGLEKVRVWRSMIGDQPPMYDMKDVKDEAKYEDFVFILTDGYQAIADDPLMTTCKSAIDAVEKHALYVAKPDHVTWRYYTVRADNEKPSSVMEAESAEKLPKWFAHFGGQSKDIILNPQNIGQSVIDAFKDMQDVLQNNDIIDCGVL
jgi:uncharacterized protein YegL